MGMGLKTHAANHRRAILQRHPRILIKFPP